MPHFTHVFASDGYSAGYYRYLWADVLAADAFEAFMQGKGPFDAKVAARLRERGFPAVRASKPGGKAATP